MASAQYGRLFTEEDVRAMLVQAACWAMDDETITAGEVADRTIASFPARSPLVITYRMALAAGVLLGCAVGLLWQAFSAQAVPAVFVVLVVVGLLTAVWLAEEIDRAPGRDPEDQDPRLASHPHPGWERGPDGYPRLKGS